ncbi:MAG: glycoside hydrolase, partial [Treponema sp.]|nr:glycoside hydrolase [Treponema sp.]
VTYTPIRWLDISGEKYRDIMISEGTPELYNGHPTTVMLDDNKTIFCTWSKGPGGPAAFLARSEDGGLTWRKLPVPDDWLKTENCPSIYKLTDRQGKQRLFVFAAKPGMSRTYSEDNGKTWSPVKSLDKPCVMAFTSILRLKNGNYLGLYHGYRNSGGDKDLPGAPQRVWGSLSEDGGLTWKESFPLPDRPDKSPCEPCLIRSPDGNELMVLMRDESRTGSSLVMYSRDEGNTWSAIEETVPYLTGDRHVAKYTPDGRLVVTFRDRMAGSPFYGHFVAWVGKYEDIVNKREGQYRIKLLHSYAGWDCGYPGLEILPDGTIIATTYIKYREGNDRHSIVSARFKLEDLNFSFYSVFDFP